MDIIIMFADLFKSDSFTSQASIVNDEQPLRLFLF